MSKSRAGNFDSDLLLMRCEPFIHVVVVFAAWPRAVKGTISSLSSSLRVVVPRARVSLNLHPMTFLLIQHQHNTHDDTESLNTNLEIRAQ